MPIAEKVKTGKTHFELTAHFERVVEYRKGFPRVVQVRQGETSFVCKITKELRPEFANLELNSQLQFTGYARAGEETTKRKITGFRSLDPARPGAPAPVTIQVCSKKHCWKNGGSDIWHRLESRVAELDLKHVNLQKTGCLGNCKNCPSARVPSTDLLVGNLDKARIDLLLPRSPPAEF